MPRPDGYREIEKCCRTCGSSYAHHQSGEEVWRLWCVADGKKSPISSNGAAPREVWGKWYVWAENREVEQNGLCESWKKGE